MVGSLSPSLSLSFSIFFGNFFDSLEECKFPVHYVRPVCGKEKKIQKHKNHYYACALAEHATVNYVYFELSNFLFLCAEYEKKAFG